jgi:hypothetical protein
MCTSNAQISVGQILDLSAYSSDRSLEWSKPSRAAGRPAIDGDRDTGGSPARLADDHGAATVSCISLQTERPVRETLGRDFDRLRGIRVETPLDVPCVGRSDLGEGEEGGGSSIGWLAGMYIVAVYEGVAAGDIHGGQASCRECYLNIPSRRDTSTRECVEGLVVCG